VTGFIGWLSDSFAGRLVVYAAGGVVLYFLMRFVIPRFTRKTKLQLDDVILGTLRLPLPFLLFFAGLLSSLRMTGVPDSIGGLLSKLCCLAFIVFGALLALRLLRRVVVQYAETRARQSESNLDDVLTPLLCRRVIPLILGVAVAVGVLSVIGVRWESLLTVLGGLSFLLIFLFQEPLSNLFSGVYLVIDVPFKYGDLIILEDGSTYRVDEIGARVTRLYNTGDHTLAYVPNNSLAGQRLINLTRPNVELRMRMPIGVAYQTDAVMLARIPEILQGIAIGHPHVLAPFKAKEGQFGLWLDGIDGSEQEAWFRAHMKRLEVEAGIRDLGERAIRKVELLALTAARFECRGLDREERAYLGEGLLDVRRLVLEIRRRLTLWMQHVSRLDAAYQEQGVLDRWSLASLEAEVIDCETTAKWEDADASQDVIASELLSRKRLAILGTLQDVDEEFYLSTRPFWQEFLRHLESPDIGKEQELLSQWLQEQPAWSLHQDMKSHYENWHKPIRDLMNRLNRLGDPSKWRAEREFSVDESLHGIVDLLRSRFLLAPAGWQSPSADFVGFGASSLDFTLEFFVDDLVREHFSRLDDTLSEIGLEILRRFSDLGIEIPYPQTDIHFRDAWLRDALARRNG